MTIVGIAVLLMAMLTESSQHEGAAGKSCTLHVDKGVTSSSDLAKPANISSAAECLRACVSLEACCIAQFNPSHDKAKCDLKSAGSLRPRPANGVTAILCTGIPCPASPAPPAPPAPPEPPPSPPPPHPPSPPGWIRISPGDNVDKIINDAPNSTTFLFTKGDYQRLSITARSGDTYTGDSPDPSSVVFSGAVRITSAEVLHRGGMLFAAPNRTEVAHSGAGECDDAHPRCTFTNDLFFDSEPLLHVGNRADVNRSGTWFFDNAAKEILFCLDIPNKTAIDHDGHSLELSVVAAAFSEQHSQTTNTANVTIANLTVKMYANPALSGAVGGPPGTNWTVSNVVATLNHGVGVQVRDGGSIVRSKLIKNGQEGFHSDRGGNILIGWNEIAYNNFAGFRTGWEAGAGKLGKTDNDGGEGPGHERTLSERSVMRNNFVHHNVGRGLWCDVGDVHISYLDNIVVNNTHEGIAHEISHQAVIEGNTLCFNGVADDVWQWGSQIQVQNSDNVFVGNNTLVVGMGGGNGLGLIYQPRGNTSTRNNTIVRNTVIATNTNYSAYGFNGAVANCANGGSRSPPFEAWPGLGSNCRADEMWANTTFDFNLYFFAAGGVNAAAQKRFRWSQASPINFTDWQRSGNDRHGSALPLGSGVPIPPACFAV